MKKMSATVFVLLVLASFAPVHAQIFDQGGFSCVDLPPMYDFEGEGGSIFGLYEGGSESIDIRLLQNVDLDLLEQRINALMPYGFNKNIFHKIGKFFNDLGDAIDRFVDWVESGGPWYGMSTNPGGTPGGQHVGAAANRFLKAADYYASRTLVENGVSLRDARQVIMDLQGTRIR